MASFDFDSVSGRYHIRFRYAGKPFKRSLQLEDEGEAQRVCGIVEETLKDLDVKQKRSKNPPLQIKIEQAGLREWFKFGGFSDQFSVRSELIAQAAAKAPPKTIPNPPYALGSE